MAIVRPFGMLTLGQKHPSLVVTTCQFNEEFIILIYEREERGEREKFFFFLNNMKPELFVF